MGPPKTRRLYSSSGPSVAITALGQDDASPLALELPWTSTAEGPHDDTTRKQLLHPPVLPERYRIPRMAKDLEQQSHIRETLGRLGNMKNEQTVVVSMATNDGESYTVTIPVVVCFRGPTQNKSRYYAFTEYRDNFPIQRMMFDDVRKAYESNASVKRSKGHDTDGITVYDPAYGGWNVREFSIDDY